MLCRLPFLWIGFRRELAEFGFNAPCGFLRSKLVAHRPIGATPLSDVGNVTQHDPNSVVPTRWLVFVIPILWRQSTPSTRLTMWFAVRTDVRRLLARSEQYPDILIPSTWRMNGLWCRDDILFYISFVLILFSSFSIFFLLLDHLRFLSSFFFLVLCFHCVSYSRTYECVSLRDRFSFFVMARFAVWLVRHAFPTLPLPLPHSTFICKGMYHIVLYVIGSFFGIVFLYFILEKRKRVGVIIIKSKYSVEWQAMATRQPIGRWIVCVCDIRRGRGCDDSLFVGRWKEREREDGTTDGDTGRKKRGKIHMK